jgi:transposase-like protein
VTKRRQRKLTFEQRDELAKLRAEGMSISQLARRYGVNERAIAYHLDQAKQEAAQS